MSLPEKCPLCHAGMERQVVVTPHVFGHKGSQNRAFFHCETCDVRYQYPGLTPEEEAHFYAEEFEGFMASRAGASGGWLKAESHIAANEQTRLRRMAYIGPHLKERLRILEVGCSSGFMLYPLAEAGHQCTGIEPSGVFSKFVRQRGLPVFEGVERLRESEPDARFDIIFHFFVLEHVRDPLKFLLDQLDLLKPQGKIIFEVPNAADPIYTIYDIPAFERFYWSVAHPWYFSEPSLNYLLSRVGCSFEIIRDQRYDLSNHMVWARDGRPGGMGRFSEVLGSDFDQLYKQALVKSGHCDTLVGFVSKD